jgi:hypothetical protein
MFQKTQHRRNESLVPAVFGLPGEDKSDSQFWSLAGNSLLFFCKSAKYARVD